MVRARWIVSFSLVAAVGLVPPAGADAPPATIRLGVLSGMFRGVPPVLVQSAATPFRELFKKHTGLEGDVAVVDDYETLAARLDDKSLELGVFHGFEWAWVKDRHSDLCPLVVTVPARKIQACVVVRADAKAVTPADLRGASVAVPVGTKAHVQLYYERLVETLPAGCCRPAKDADRGPDEAIEAVIEGTVPAALLDAAALSAYQSNKPGRAMLLKVLVESDPFPPTVVAYRKDGLAAKDAAKIRAGLVKATTNAQGKAFLFLWKLKGFDDVPAGFDADLRQLLKAYPPPRPAGATTPE